MPSSATKMGRAKQYRLTVRLQICNPAKPAHDRGRLRSLDIADPYTRREAQARHNLYERCRTCREERCITVGTMR